jgi:hypothetical protein
MLVAIVFTKDKLCGLVAIGREGLKAKTTVGRQVEASGTAVSTIHGTSFFWIQYSLVNSIFVKSNGKKCILVLHSYLLGTTYVVHSESSWTRFIKSVFYVLSGTSFISPSKYSPSYAMHLSHLHFHWLKHP